jgi:hypothetical protein
MLAPAEAGGDSDRDDASALPHLYISGVEPDIRPTAFQRTVQESLDLFIDLAAQPRHLAFGDVSAALNP